MSKKSKIIQFDLSHVGLLKSSVQIILGGFLAAFGIKGFLFSSHFIDGGVTGISMLLENIFHWNLAVLLIIINLPFIILGHRHMGIIFAIKSVISIIILSLFLEFFPYPDVTPDKLLTAVFGGFFIGSGIGLAIRGGAVLDGTEIAALLISRHLPFLKVGDAILCMNVIIFSLAAFVLGTEPAMYSILTYFTAAKMVDFVVNGLEEFISVTIVSNKSEQVRHALIDQLHRGVTVYKGKTGFNHGDSNKEIDILYSVATRFEIGRLETALGKIDPDAFIVYQSINDIKGGFVRKKKFL